MNQEKYINEIMPLYQKGMKDMEISRILYISSSTVSKTRLGHGLPANRMKYRVTDTRTGQSIEGDAGKCAGFMGCTPRCFRSTLYNQEQFGWGKNVKYRVERIGKAQDHGRMQKSDCRRF